MNDPGPMREQCDEDEPLDAIRERWMLHWLGDPETPPKFGTEINEPLMRNAAA